MRRAQEGPSSKSLASTSESEYLVMLTFKHRCGLKTGKHGVDAAAHVTEHVFESKAMSHDCTHTPTLNWKLCSLCR